VGTVDVPLIYKKSLDYQPLWKPRWQYMKDYMSQNIGGMDLHVLWKTNSEITEKHKIIMLHQCHSHFWLFHIASLQQYYLSFSCLTGKNNVAQQDLHLCQYSSPKKCPDMNLSVTVAITITTWFKKCLSSKLSTASDEKSFSIFHFYFVAFFAFNYQ